MALMALQVQLVLCVSPCIAFRFVYCFQVLRIASRVACCARQLFYVRLYSLLGSPPRGINDTRLDRQQAQARTASPGMHTHMHNAAHNLSPGLAS
jgi:hypothetical protein